MNERTDDDSETGGQRQSEDLLKQGMSNTCSESDKRQHTNTIRYFSMFTGVGGFELGLEAANNTEKSAGENVCEECCGKPSCEHGQQSSTKGYSKPFSKVEQNWEGWNSPINEWGELLRSRSIPSFRCVGQSEWDKYSSQVLKYRFPNIKNWGDCTKIKPEDLPDFDMLCGGFPCQAFSIAGKRRGFEDTRGTMFFEVARILKVKRPKIVLLENVKGLLNHDKGKTFRVIIQTLDELGYEVQWMVLNSKFFGVPQNRERVLIIGSLRGERRPEILPFGESNEPIIKMEDLRKTITKTLCARGQSDLHSGLQLVGEARAVLTPDRAEKRQNGRRFKEPGEEAFTVTSQDIHGVATATSIRRLTPVECCRLQGFPDDWNEWGIDDKGEKVKMSDTQRYKQMGNAVTTNVIQAVGSQILNNTTEVQNEKE